MRKMIRNFGLWLAHTLGTRIVDFETGEPLGRVFMIPWRGKIHVIGLVATVRPIFLPQKRLTYWKQEIGLATHPTPDFPNERSLDVNGSPSKAHRPDDVA